MEQKLIPQMEPWFGAEEKSALCAYMDENGWLTENKHTAQFEKLIAGYTKTKHCIVVNNGTVALIVAAIACGIGPGDEVIVPNYTMIATPNSVKILGANPVFVDVEESTLCLDIEKVRSAITSKTKAIILVSANGRYPKCGIDSFIELAKQQQLHLIEDAAQSLGSHFPNGHHIGTMGSVGTFSFSAPKVISTGQGGALVTNDDALAQKIRRLKDFGRASGGTDVHESIGYNFKFTELQACIGIEQMKKLPWRVERKKEIYSQYRSQLSSTSQIQFFDQDTNHTTPWFIDIFAQDRDKLKQYLQESGVGTRMMYPPINRQTAYNIPGSYPISERVGREGLWLPSASQLTDKQIDYVCTRIRDFYLR